ncbi:hypothetical protein PLEOSDRAFT_1106021 [Pleurotus ostreatus PC15]|uniref:Uncharacterized protein n=1 Tax=Pleurotus ostreatus (strain PC15) TaxID=1137138 RepID=A0A067NSQ5_PLEO1|nr:hypothetical protein PLEOSDRAFT_1106021 [Pleurotus ostreatus PC15]
MSVPASDSATGGQQVQGPPRRNENTSHSRGTPLVASALAAHNALHRVLARSGMRMKKDGSFERIPREFKYPTYKAWRLRNERDPSKGIHGHTTGRIPFAKPGDKTSGLSSLEARAMRALLCRREARHKQRRINDERKMAILGIVIKNNRNGGTSRRRHRTSIGAKSPLSREVMLLEPDEDEGGDTDMAEGGDTDVAEGGDTDVEGEDAEGAKVRRPNALKRQRTEIAENIELPARQLGGHRRGEGAGNPNDGPPSAKRARRAIPQPASRPRNFLVRRQAMLAGTVGTDVEMTD